MDFDAVVLGTGLSEAIAAAALAKAGYKIVHIDHNQYYGGDDASLSLDELVEWARIRSDASSDDPPDGYLANQRTRFTTISCSPSLPAQSRQYAVSLAPTLIPSIGPHIDSLIASGVSRYGGFKLLEKVAVYDRPGFVQNVPGSKEDVFKSKVLSLMDKRRLMRFLLFAAGDFEGKKELEGKENTSFVQFLQETFSLNSQAISAVAYALAFCVFAQDTTLPALQRIRQYLRSSGRYGTSPFLVGHYGGLGEISQGFCRVSAVQGSTYILGRSVTSVRQASTDADTTNEHKYNVELDDFPDVLSAKVVIASPDYLPPTLLNTSASSDASPSPNHPIARCIAIIDKPISFRPSSPEESEPADTTPTQEADEEQVPQVATPTFEVDTALLIFPPSSLPNGSPTTAASVLVTGEGTQSVPRGRWIVYLSLPLHEPTSTPTQALLQPYLDATLSLTGSSEGTDMQASPTQPLFTLYYTEHPSASSTTSPDIIVSPPRASLLPEIADTATTKAESMFWEAIEALKRAGVQRKVAEGESEEVDAFWAPLDAVEDDTGEEW